MSSGPLRPHRPWWPALRVVRAIAVACCLVAAGTPRALHAQERPLSGVWSFDREASRFPSEFGFGADFLPTQRPDGAGPRRPGGGGLPLRPQGESYEDGQRRQQLTAAVRTPPLRLTVKDAADAVTFTDDQGNARVLHPDGRAETVQLGSVPLLVTTRRDSGNLVVLYAVADLRQLRYTYSRTDNPDRLVIDVQFVERGTAGDAVRLVYKPFTAPDAPVTTGAASSAPPAPGPGRSGAPAAPPSSMPRAGSEFTGLTRLGVVVEEPGQMAWAAG